MMCTTDESGKYTIVQLLRADLSDPNRAKLIKELEVIGDTTLYSVILSVSDIPTMGDDVCNAILELRRKVVHRDMGCVFVGSSKQVRESLWSCARRGEFLYFLPSIEEAQVFLV